MSENGTFMRMKEIYYSLVDSNGNFRTIPIGQVQALKFGKDRILAFRALITLLTQTDFASYETKLYIQSRDLSVYKIYRDLNYSGYYGKVLDQTSDSAEYLRKRAEIVNKVYYDQTRLHKAIGKETVENLFNQSIDVSDSIKRINSLLVKYTNVSDILALDIDRDCTCSELSDDEFDNFLDAVSPYFKARIELVRKSVSHEQAGYFNYIMGCPDAFLTDVDKERKRKILNMSKMPKIES